MSSGTPEGLLLDGYRNENEQLKRQLAHFQGMAESTAGVNTFNEKVIEGLKIQNELLKTKLNIAVSTLEQINRTRGGFSDNGMTIPYKAGSQAGMKMLADYAKNALGAIEDLKRKGK